MLRATIRVVVGVLMIVGIVLLPASGQTSELRIVDQQGLNRAVKVIQDRANVIVDLTDQTADSKALSCRLVHTEGLASDLPCQSINNQRIVFRNVSPGTWRIEIAGDNAAIGTVKIEQ